MRVLKDKPIGRIDDETLILADQADKATHQLRAAVQELLSERLDPAKCEALAEQLSDGRYTHDYAITSKEATSMGLNVVTGVPSQFFDLMSLYPQPVRRQAGVEFLPRPRRLPRPEGDPKAR